MHLRRVSIFLGILALGACGGGGGGSSSDYSMSSSSTAATTTSASGTNSSSSSSTSSSASSSTSSTSSSTPGDASDDTLSGFVVDGYIANALVFIDLNSDGAHDAAMEPSATSDATGAFAINLDADTAEALNAGATVIAVGGEDIATGNALATDTTFMVLGSEQREGLIISPLTTLAALLSQPAALPQTLGLADDNSLALASFDPVAKTEADDPTGKSALLLSTQATIIAHSLAQAIDGLDFKTVFVAMAKVLEDNSDTISSFGDTSFLKQTLDQLLVANTNLSWNAETQSDLVGVLSSFAQKMYAEADRKVLNAFFDYAYTTLAGELQDIVGGTASDSLVKAYLEDALAKVEAKHPNISFEDIEANFRAIDYAVAANGSSNYTVDGINASDEAFIIYARVGDVINFVAQSNGTFTAHPFRFSTVADDTSGSNALTETQGASYSNSTSTLTVTAATPTMVYPYCSVHSGMYAKGRIEIVADFTDFVDRTDGSGALRVEGTVSSGPYAGASGHTYDVYLTPDEALSVASGYHAHEFVEFPGMSFYMPNDAGKHGATTANESTQFKPKSHYRAASESGTPGGY